MLILGIESSCDETAAAVVENGRKIVSSVVATQIEKHKIFGGVVPEIASRMHTEAICAVTKQALSDANCKMSDIDAIAVTYAPADRRITCRCKLRKGLVSFIRSTVGSRASSSFSYCR